MGVTWKKQSDVDGGCARHHLTIGEGETKNCFFFLEKGKNETKAILYACTNQRGNEQKLARFKLINF